MHEYAHGWAAYRLGDQTAKNEGRLTLNPFAHIDLMGTIIMPLLLFISEVGFIIGWAKPVPYNPYNLRDQKYGELKVAVAGPGINFLIALTFGFLARLIPLEGILKIQLVFSYFKSGDDFLLSQMQGSFLTSLFVLSVIVCFINLLLTVFNLIPIPSLDGSKVLTAILPYQARQIFYRIEPYGFFIIIFLLASNLFSFILPVILFLFSLIIGI
jgi:Zn-dependent protease